MCLELQLWWNCNCHKWKRHPKSRTKLYHHDSASFIHCHPANKSFWASYFGHLLSNLRSPACCTKRPKCNYFPVWVIATMRRTLVIYQTSSFPLSSWSIRVKCFLVAAEWKNIKTDIISTIMTEYNFCFYLTFCRKLLLLVVVAHE